MSGLFKLCQSCQAKPATVKCYDCNQRFCYNCETKAHTIQKGHQTEVIPYSQMKQSRIDSQRTQRAKVQITSTPPNQTLVKSVLFNQNLVDELENLTKSEQQQRSQLLIMEEKQNKQISKLEQEYENKIIQFEKEVEKNEKALTQYANNNIKGEQINELMEELKQQLVSQKKAAEDRLLAQKQILGEKENVLKEFMKQEKQQTAEIQQKEILIKKFKELLQQQQQEKELIVGENQKIKGQLMEIKELFKSKLPQLGLDPEFLNFDDPQEEEEEEVEEDENQQELQQQAQPQAHDSSTGDDC